MVGWDRFNPLEIARMVIWWILSVTAAFAGGWYCHAKFGAKVKGAVDEVL